MKNILSLNGNGLKFWLFTLIALPLCANANNSDITLNSGEAEEFFADDKEWEVSHFISNPAYLIQDGKKIYKECIRINVKVAGEEMIEGKLCKRLEIVAVRKLTYDYYYGCDYCLYWPIPNVIYGYEENGKVYVYRIADYITGSDPEELKEAYDSAPKSFQEIYDSQIDSDNGQRHWHTFNNSSVEWIDGVGWNYGFGKLDMYFFDIGTGVDYPYYKLVKCTKNGVPLYDKTEELATILDTPTGAEVICAEENEGPYYNLQGIKVSNPIKGELYLFNGKKSVY